MAAAAGGAAPSGERAKAPFNFSPASSRDSVVHGCSMPGNNKSTPGPAGAAEVTEWATFMRPRGITDVVVLLGDDELADSFSPPGLEAMYRAEGFTPHMHRVRSPGAHGKIMAVFDAAAAAGRKAVTHCSGGSGRVGTVLTAWLAHRYGLPPAEAGAEVEAAAAAAGADRFAPKAARFEEFVSGKGW